MPVLMPDTSSHPQECYEVHVTNDQSCFGAPMAGVIYVMADYVYNKDMVI